MEPSPLKPLAGLSQALRRQIYKSGSWSEVIMESWQPSLQENWMESSREAGIVVASRFSSPRRSSWRKVDEVVEMVPAAGLCLSHR